MNITALEVIDIVTCYATEDTHFELLLRLFINLHNQLLRRCLFPLKQSQIHCRIFLRKFSSPELSASDRETLITDCFLQKLFTN
jgi:hypothetical protein